MKTDNIIILIVLILSVLYGFLGPNKDGYSFKNWENVSVTTTIIYAVVLYGFGLFGGKFDKLKRMPKAFVITFLVIIIFITIPFSSAFLGEFFKVSFLNKLALILDGGRIVKMWLLTITASFFLVIDVIMMKSEGDDKIKFHINLKYSELPVFGAFIILLAYSYFLGDIKITKYGLDSFFAGAVAFQMISSNIVWMQNDDKLWESIKSMSNKEKN